MTAWRVRLVKSSFSNYQSALCLSVLIFSGSRADVRKLNGGGANTPKTSNAQIGAKIESPTPEPSAKDLRDSKLLRNHVCPVRFSDIPHV